MQVFKAFFKVARSNFTSTIIYFVIFAFIMIAFVLSESDPTINFSSASTEIYLIDHDNSAASAGLTKYLSSMHSVTKMDFDKEVLLDNLFYRTVQYIIEIPKGYELDLKNPAKDTPLITYRIPNSYQSAFIDRQITSFIKSSQLYLYAGYTIHDTNKLVIQDLNEAAAPVEVLNFDNQHNNSKQTAYFFQYLGYVMMAGLLVGLTPVLTAFRSRDLEKRMICSSLTLTRKNVQLTLGCFVYAILNWGLMLVFCFIVCGNTLTKQQLNYSVLNSFVLLLVYIALTFFVSCFVQNYNSLSMVSNILSLGMSFLCGIFVSQDLLGENILAVSKFLPVYWYIKINNMISGLSDEVFTVDSYWKYLGIELTFAAAILGMSLVFMKTLSGSKKEG